jgi:hypothetical protein
MHSSRYPCRVCGQATDGLDTYVICLDCAEEYELRSDGPVKDRPEAAPSVVLSLYPLSEDEQLERLRALLDDW